MVVGQQSVAFGGAILEALGLKGAPVDRIVIVADIDDIPRVYVRGLLPESAVPGIVRAVKDVQVSAAGDVTVLPFAEEVGAADEMAKADAEIDRLQADLERRNRRGCRRT